jgi:tetratricopeptide (TPR) repeat protein
MPAVGRMSTILILLSALMSFAISCSLADRIDRDRKDVVGEELMYFPSGLFMREFSLGHAPLLADLIWLRGIQYYGEHKRTDRNFQYLSHIFNTLTTLDPQFSAGYIFGSLVISQEAGDVASAIRLLETGVRRNPDSWELLFETGFTYYVFLADYRKSAEYFRLAAKIPNCPEYVTRFAAYSSSKSGDVGFAVKLWAELMRNTKNQQMREIAERNIRRLTLKRS